MSIGIKQKLCVILWKSFVFRKRSPILSVLECVFPILMLYIFYLFIKLLFPQQKKYDSEDRPVDALIMTSKFTPPILSDYIAIGYAPSNENTDRMFAQSVWTVNVTKYDAYGGESVTTKSRVTKIFDSEGQLDSWLKEENGRETKDGAKKELIGVVFLETDIENGVLKYKIKIGATSYQHQNFFYLEMVQMRLDHAILKIANVDVDHAYTGYMPDPRKEYNMDSLVIAKFLYIYLCFAYAIFALTLTRNVIHEKETGMKEISRMAGMTACMWWSQWLVYTLALHLPVAVVAVLVALVPPVMPAGTVHIAILLLLLYVVNITVLVFATSCLFNSSVKGTIFVLFAWLALHFTTLPFVALSPESKSVPSPWLERLFCVLAPSFNLVNAYKIILLLAYWSDWSSELMFQAGAPVSHVSVAGAIALFAASTCLYALLTLALDAVHPGPYGVAVTFETLRSRFRRGHAGDAAAATGPLPQSYEAPPKGAKVGVEIRRLSKTFGWCRPTVAVRRVDLDVYEGEIMALLGHNGAGKTTTMSMITGMYSPSGGTIRVAGSGASSIKRSLGFCPQHNVYFPKLTLIEHLMFFGMLKGLSRGRAEAQGAEILSTLGLADKKNVVGGKLSGGMKRRLCLAMALAGDPAVLVLDEPTSGLDPENRRVIWDIVLGMRGSKTILITTHFMEEADVLGDRIAIMDGGEVVCCGTTMFLKRIYGTGYQVHLLKNKNVAAKDLAKFVNQNFAGERVSVKTVSPTEASFVLKENDVNLFPALFQALEAAKSDLGVKGVSVTCSTLEDVFINVANKSTFLDDNQADREKTAKPSSETSSRSVIRFSNRLTGVALIFQRFLTLVCKRFIYFKRHCISFFIKMLFCCILIAAVAYNMEPSRKVSTGKITLHPRAGSSVLVAHDASGKEMSDAAAKLLKRYTLSVEILPEGQKLEERCLQLAREDYAQYRAKYVYGLSFFGGNITLLRNTYWDSDNVVFNLFSNILLAQNSKLGSIETTIEPYGELKPSCFPVSDGLYNTLMSVITIGLMLLMTEFVPFVLDERSSGFKHQQYLAGVSPALYWSANLLADLLIYMLVALVFLLILVTLSWSTFPLYSEWTWWLAGVLVFHGISALCLAYAFCFLFRGPVAGLAAHTALNLISGLIAANIMVSYLWYIQDRDPRGTIIDTILFILTLNPTFCAAMCTFHIVKTASDASLCRIPDCYSKSSCEGGEPTIIRMPTDLENDAILPYLISLSLIWVVYLAATLAIDYNLPRRLIEVFTRRGGCGSGRESLDDGENEDEDVRKERERVLALGEAGDVETPLRVERLAKKFCRGPRAVRDVSFAVGRGECFGLLGVNGAGKTTTFRMITGETAIGAGDAVILGDSVKRNRRRYMQRVGYCPQFDSALGCLTGRETLWTVTRLRGVSSKEVRSVVDKWMEELGFEELADKQASTYSGGTRRKLSTAMAGAGEPTVVFLDEPTTGVDPAARRRLWSALQLRKRSGESIVLTSHSMEECEALCDRLTILVKGRMVCVGGSEQLKAKFSQGYNVLVKIKGDATDADRDAVKRAFERQFPSSELKDEHQTMFTYKITDPSIPLSRLFTAMLKIRSQQSGVEDFSVSNTTLEQLFLSFARNAQK